MRSIRPAGPYTLRSLAAGALSATLLFGCDDGATAPRTVLLASAGGDSVFIGRARVFVLLSAHDSAVITASPAQWHTSDSTVAAAAGGAIIGLDPGRVTVTATLDGTTLQAPLRVVPLHADGGRRFASSITSFAETCAFDQSGVVYCGATGAVDSIGTLGLRAGSGAVTFTEFHSTRYHRCGLAGAGRLQCAGGNGRGQLGLGGTTPSYAADFVDAVNAPRFSTIGVGGAFATSVATCGIGFADSVVYCVGTANVANDTVFRPVSGGLRALGLGLGRGHACAIALDRSAWCWGQDSRGALGPTQTTTLAPQLIPGGDQFAQVTSGSHSCGVTLQHQLKCWGSNQNGQLGLGIADTDNHPAPARVNIDGDVAFALAGNSFTCAVTTAGALFCFGRELPIAPALHARLGNSLDGPVRLAPSIRFRSLSADAQRLCGVTADQAVVCL